MGVRRERRVVVRAEVGVRVEVGLVEVVGTVVAGAGMVAVGLRGAGLVVGEVVGGEGEKLKIVNSKRGLVGRRAYWEGAWVGCPSGVNRRWRGGTQMGA